ncbi:MAG: ribbon-helix-helix protein, CopG family [Gammaproteobacteria bacterium]
MVRTQIQLTEPQYQRLKALSSAQRRSLSQLIREAVDAHLSQGQAPRAALYRDALAIVGRHQADVDDAAAAHDRYLSDAFSG